LCGEEGVAEGGDDQFGELFAGEVVVINPVEDRGVGVTDPAL
jgi:hypothetical protein